MLPLEQDTIRKRRVNDLGNNSLELERGFKAGNNKEYKVKAIIDNAVHSVELNNPMSDLYFLVLWKNYSEEESTWKPSLAVIYFRQLLNTFYQEHLKNSITSFALVDSALLMAG